MALKDLLKEATDSATAPERLRELARHQEATVRRAAWKNPSLPEDAWRTALLEEGDPEAWANPMAPIYLLTWAPREDDPRPLDNVARLATQALWEDPGRCSTEGKALIAAKVQEWWATCEKATRMIIFLGWWARAKEHGSQEHRKVLRILVLCVRTAPHLTTDDHQALEFLEAWGRGGKDRRNKAQALAKSKIVKEVYRFAWDISYGPWYALHEFLEAVALVDEKMEHDESEAEHSRNLADVIRREMPMPPVVQ
jgi:hypothetical protein